MYAEHEIDLRFESINQELDNFVDKKMIEDVYLYEQIYRSIKKGQKLDKVYKVNWNHSVSHVDSLHFL